VTENDERFGEEWGKSAGERGRDERDFLVCDCRCTSVAELQRRQTLGGNRRTREGKGRESGRGEGWGAGGWEKSRDEALPEGSGRGVLDCAGGGKRPVQRVSRAMMSNGQDSNGWKLGGKADGRREKKDEKEPVQRPGIPERACGREHQPSLAPTYTAGAAGAQCSVE